MELVKAFTLKDIDNIPIAYTTFIPQMDESERQKRYNLWLKAIKAVLLYT